MNWATIKEEIRKIDQQLFPDKKIRSLAILIIVMALLVPEGEIKTALTVFSGMGIALLRGSKS